MIRVRDLSEAEELGYLIADNQIALNAEWDQEALSAVLIELTELEFDIEVLGFETGVVDVALGRAELPSEPDRAPPALQSGPPVSNPGDVWRVDQHRLICGDATKPETYQSLLGDERAEASISDPPYNVAIAGHVSGNGRVTHDEFVEASGEKSDKEFQAFLKTFASNLVAYSADGSVHFIFMDWRHSGVLEVAVSDVFTKHLNTCVWTKTNGGMGSLYRSAHELVFVYRAGEAGHINNVQLGKHGRNRTNVWSYPGMNAFGSEREAALEMHPTVKPVQLVADAILDVTRPGGLVLDAFCGSGTTLLAAERVDRRAACIELDPKYVDVALRRYQAETGTEPIHDATGLTFSEMSEDRASADEEAA